jgi:TolB-like protein
VSVWDGRAVSDSAISSRIKSARQLLGDNGGAQRMIRTVYGKGFRFVGAGAPCANEASRNLEPNGGKPSIAVLPFDCTEQGLSTISDGIPHDLIVALSRLRSLMVVARGSSFRLWRRPVNLARVRALLGVNYVLTGTVRRLGNRVAVDVELADARTGTVVWGDLHEGALERLHEMRATILAQLVSALKLRISRYEAELAQYRAPDELAAWSCYHAGLRHIFRFNPSDNAEALRYFEHAAAREPSFSQAHAGVSFARWQNAFMRYTDDVDEEVRQARKSAEAAIELDEEDPTANLMLGRSLWLEGEIESSVPWLERAITLSPNYAQAIYARAWAHMILCQGEAGGRNARMAIGLSPIDPLRYAMLAIDGFTHAMLGDRAAGAELLDRAAREPRAHVMIAVMAAVCHVWAGRQKQARYWAKTINSRCPTLTGEVFLASFPFSEGSVRTRVCGALSRLGM